MALTENKPKYEGTKIKIAVVNGSLLLDEIEILVQCVREIEQNKRGRVINVFLNVSDINITAGDGFSVEELMKIAQCIREIEQNKPERHIDVLMDTPEKTVEEMEEVLGSVKPAMPFKTVIEFGKKDKGK